MIWYLLYPFRGTKEPLSLDARNPIRSSFTRYGTCAARNPIRSLVISVAIAAFLIFPFPFLYTNTSANGASNLPHHVWTSAQPYDGDSNIRPDVVMRSFWVHGSFMKALKSDVLQAALEIQNEILGPTIDFDPRQAPNQVHISLDPLTPDLTTDIRDSFHAINGLSNSSWFFHSPLQYWGCSKERIETDRDIIQTVNDGSRQSTSVNVTLRHSIVFSGKRFEDRRLVAADALVVTLVHMLDSPVGKQWERRAQSIAQRGSGKWEIIPPDLKSSASSLYEFRFQPLSVKDDLILIVIYSVAVAYYLWTLRKMKALKSRVGLVFATLAQLAVSIMSSFTICATLKIDLSKIPRVFYPIGIIFFTFNCICDLIDAVIQTPSDRPTYSRMGEAWGQKGHIALISLATNIAILWLLSAVAPAAKDFTIFLGLALILDYFFLLTFFTAVLSIDVRRTELSDSLNRITSEKDTFSTDIQQTKTWIDPLLAGEGLISARVAGTIVMIGSVLIAQWHFHDDETFWGSISKTCRSLWSLISQKQISHPSIASFPSNELNQARTPGAWLRLQDHETAHEVIKVIKPHATSYIARVYDPIVFVLRGSDRTRNHSGVRPFLPAAYDFMRNWSGTWLTFIVILSAAVWLLMNYLLWDNSPEVEYEERPDDEPLLSVKTLSHGHYLDIALVEASKDGIVVTVGLDRCIRVWDIRNGVLSYIIHDPDSNNDPFPVLALAIDRDTNWLAILSAKDQVILWNIPERRWGSVMSVDVRGRTPASFCFGYDKTELIDPVIVTRHNGMMTELHMEANVRTDLRVCHSPLVCVRPHFEKPTPLDKTPPPLRILTSSRKGCVHVASQLETGWVSEGLELREAEGDREIRAIHPLPALSSFLAIRDHTIDLVDIVTHNITHTFSTKPMKPDTLRCFHSTRRRPQCGSVGLAYLALAYTCAETGDCILQSYLPQRDGDTICFRDPWTPGSKTCCLWRETVEQNFVIENPGEWRTLQIGYVVGVRKRESPTDVQETMSIVPSSVGSGLRRRGGFHQRPFSQNAHKPQEVDEDVWEAWSISARGERSTAPLSNGQYGSEHLLVSELGPMKRVGKGTIAVALGNVVKVITVGHGRFDDSQDDDNAAFVGMAATTRKKKHTTPQRKRTY